MNTAQIIIITVMCILAIICYFKIAKESLQSLIQANGLDVNKNYLILKKL